MDKNNSIRNKTFSMLRKSSTYMIRRDPGYRTVFIKNRIRR